jgi:hypothetical protein
MNFSSIHPLHYLYTIILTDNSMKKLYTFFCSVVISTLAYSQACDSLHSQCIGTFSRNGLYFDLEAITDVRVTGISYLVQNSGTRDVSVYYRQGTYLGHEGIAVDWTFLGIDSAVTPVNGGSCPLPHNPMPVDLNICIPQGQRYGFYIVMSSGTGTIESHSNLTEGSIAAQDIYIKLITGKGQFGIGDFTGTLTPSLTFQGAIQYDCLCTTSLDEKQSAKEISVYPNPADNTINFSGVANASTLSRIEIYNTAGELVLLSREISFDISSLSQGMYYAAVIETGKSIKHIRFIKH